MDRSLILHFASAMYEVSKEENKIEEYYSDIRYILDVFNENNDLVLFLASPTIDYSKKEKVIKDVFSSIHKSVFAFLTIVIKKHQVKYYSYIVNDYVNFMNIDKNILEGIIYTPYLLEDKKIKEIEEAFSTKYKKNIYLKQKVDKKLIGGLKININDTLYDFSLLSKIENIKEKLTYKIK